MKSKRIPTRSIKPALTILWCAALAMVGLRPVSSHAQRDHLTDPESELIRFYQEIDKRIDVFIKAADRRFAVINGTPMPPTKKLMKDEPDWGEVPKGTHAELLEDIAGILDEAITNIDDANHKNGKNAALTKALHKLSTASSGYLNQLATLKTKTTSPEELEAISHVADAANQIIEAAGKVPVSAEEEPKKKKP